MTQRIIEVFRTYFCQVGEITVRASVDLEHVQFYEESAHNGELDATKTNVYLSDAFRWVLNIPYDEFKKLHDAYKKSKEPTQVIPPEQEPPCTHPQISRADWNGSTQCASCGKLFPVPCNVELPKLSTAQEIASSTIMVTTPDPPPTPGNRTFDICTHPPDRRKIAIQGFSYCSVCGHPIPDSEHPRNLP